MGRHRNFFNELTTHFPELEVLFALLTVYLVNSTATSEFIDFHTNSFDPLLRTFLYAYASPYDNMFYCWQ